MKKLLCISIAILSFTLHVNGQESPLGDKAIATPEFLKQHNADPYGGDAHWLDLVYFKHADQTTIDDLTQVDDDWISVTAKWWATRKNIERSTNSLNSEKRKLTMEFFLGYFEGRTGLKIPERMKLHFRKSVAGRGRINFQPIGKLETKKISRYVRTDDLRFEADTFTSWSAGALRCMSANAKKQLWDTELIGLGKPGVFIGMPHSVLWAKITYDEKNKLVHYWSVTTEGAFLLEFDAESGTQSGAIRMTCATAG